MLKAVLFDLDDTLIDWSGFESDWSTLEQQHLRGVFDYISREIHPLDDIDAYYAEFRTRTTDAWAAARSSLRAPHLGSVLLETSVAFGVPPEALDQRRCLEAYRWGAAPGTALFPEVPDTIMLLQGYGIRVGIVTNAYQPMWLRDIEIRGHGLYDLFPDCRISAADVGYLKPHPTIFQSALRLVDAKADETVFVGDNLEADVGGAQGVGMRAIWRPVANRFLPPGSPIIPDATIKALDELPNIFDRWFPGWRGG